MGEPHTKSYLDNDLARAFIVGEFVPKTAWREFCSRMINKLKDKD